ncbi:UbiH/UbiF/VisC/COQ6 family ubiquinone biosynthesis hydroxylase [Thiotrichales bacterium 19S9-12]|nr:UbiH/UbiF/VisC/COQ6 family ubiquinone biosynthesis hydroxylase [Thiotrichales bacterium 19S9-11]MCF6812587.1 UbiH/UbiF/VisC/COQ6 family ubiquinone biosynthesis hydroxylase [Thiotrichales bacterium 19S9-12]
MGSIKKHQVVIIGGGLVGLATAKGLIDQGIDVAVIEKKQPKLSWNLSEKDLRVSAINRYSEQLLDQLGVWQAINQYPISPYEMMKVWDEGSEGSISMNAHDISERELGFIIENRIIVKSLWQALEAKNAKIYVDTAIHNLEEQTGSWQLMLSDGQTIQTELLVGADGQHSWLRERLAFQVKKKPYNQHAVVAEIQTEFGHKNTAYQRFLSQGPLAFLPLSDPFCSSIVWSTSKTLASELTEIDESVFNQRLTSAFDKHLGACEVKSKRVAFPLIEQHVTEYVREGVVLIGDAAHVIHPLAGQGVNQGFRDVKSLVDVLSSAHQKGRSLRALSTLKAYERERRWHNQLLIWLMAAFKSGFSNESKILGLLRGSGLSFVDKNNLLKRFFMAQAMGKQGII